MTNLGLYARLEAQPGKEKQVEDFLRNALALARQEEDTQAWFAIRMGPSTFGIFDVFENEAGRQKHLTGQIAAQLKARSSELFAKPPSIEKIDILAAKLAGAETTAGRSR